MKRYTDLFIDFDDTLYDTRRNNTLALGELYEARHWADIIPDYDTFVKVYWRVNEEEWAKYSKGEIERSELIVQRFRRPLLECVKGDTSFITADYCREVSDEYLGYCSSKPNAVEGAHELMRYLKDKGYRTHMCSNGFHEVQYKKLRASRLIDYFDTIVLSEDAGVNKPKKEYFDYAFKKTGADPKTTLMIGDNSKTDILGAIVYGIEAIWFNRWNAEQPAEIKDVPAVTSLRQLQEIL